MIPISLILFSFISNYGLFKTLQFFFDKRIEGRIEDICKKYDISVEFFHMHLKEFIELTEKYYSDKPNYIPFVGVGSQVMRFRDFKVHLNIVEKAYEQDLEIFSDEYFIGFFRGDTPITIFFEYDGSKFFIKDETASFFLGLSDEEQLNSLLYLLYLYGSGNKDGLMYSSNLGNLYTQDFADLLNSITFTGAKERERTTDK